MPLVTFNCSNAWWNGNKECKDIIVWWSKMKLSAMLWQQTASWWAYTVRVTIKFPFDVCMYAHFHSNGTPVLVPIICLYPYLSYARTSRHRKHACSQSTPVFIKRRISTRRCELFSMFAKQSTCYFCLSSVRVHGLLSPFQSVHSSQLVPSATQDGLFRLHKAENPCLLSLQEELRGNRSLFNRRGIVG